MISIAYRLKEIILWAILLSPAPSDLNGIYEGVSDADGFIRVEHGLSIEDGKYTLIFDPFQQTTHRYQVIEKHPDFTIVKVITDFFDPVPVSGATIHSEFRIFLN